MKNAKRFAAVLLTVVLVAGMLTGCKDALAQAVRKVLGTSSQAEEADTTRWAEATADPLMIEGIADPSAKYDSAITNGRLNVVFNGIWSRKTRYFTAPNGSITLTGCGTAEGVQRFKVAVWKKLDGGAEYVGESTHYIPTDGTNYRCTIAGLDPAAAYRLTISYDSSWYYLYGLVQAEGVAAA